MTEKRSTMDLLAELTKMMDFSTDPVSMDKLKQEMRMNPFHPAVQSALVDHKTKIPTEPVKQDPEAKENEARLDNMLKAEGIVGPPPYPENVEYREKLFTLRSQYEEESKTCEHHRSKFCNEVKNLLQNQSEFRPISQQAVKKMTGNVSNKFNQVAVIVKQTACEGVIQLRRKHFDARRNRRNFSKSATKLLNEYFEANINHPYPSDQVKHQLAVQCNISVSQVSNWFGNKRIRYKKQVESGRPPRPIKQEICMPPMSPYPFMHHMPPQHHPMNPFAFPDPQMMAQWQQAHQQHVNNTPAPQTVSST